VRGKKPLLAALLEHGRPLQITSQEVELGYSAGSFQYTKLKEPDALNELTSLVQAFYGATTAVKLKPLSGSTEGLPPTLLEKKSLDESTRQLELRETAADHPLVAAALEIFSGEIETVSEAEGAKKV
jgi:DNA polymerase-3 subunit gamma/tau